MTMNENDWLAQRFETRRPRLKALAYRMLGSTAEADEAVQDAWIRVSRAGAEGVESLDGWLTTIVARVCLNLLRARRTRREEPSGDHLPDPVVEPEPRGGPEMNALLADSVGVALLLVLDTLEPEERLAFVLHDMFDVPFAEIAPLVGRTPVAARQLASRARRRVRGDATPEPERDPAREREVVEAFFAAARGGDFEALVAVLHPEVVLRSEGGGERPGELVVLRGAEKVAGRAILFANPASSLRPVRVNGAPGVVASVDGEPVAVMAFTIAAGAIVEISAYADRDRLRRLAIDAIGT